MPDVLLAIVSTVAALFVSEMGFRAYVFGAHAFSLEAMNGVQSMGRAGIVERARCRGLVYSLLPNLRRSFKLVAFDTNSHGLRDREYSLKKPDNTIRVAVVGDSYTMASGVEIEEAYHSLLERRLNENDRGRTYEFINFGTGGYGLEHYTADLECRVEQWEPDLVLLGFSPRNDHRISPLETFERPFDPKPREYPGRKSFAWYELSKLVGKHWTRWTDPDSQAEAEPTSEQIAHTHRHFRAIGAWSKEHDVPVVVAYLTYRKNEPVQPEWVAEISKAYGLDFLDLSAAFRDEDRKRLRIYLTDSHPNPEAHQRFADQIYDHLLGYREFQRP